MSRKAYNFPVGSRWNCPAMCLYSGEVQPGIIEITEHIGTHAYRYKIIEGMENDKEPYVFDVYGLMIDSLTPIAQSLPEKMEDTSSSGSDTKVALPDNPVAFVSKMTWYTSKELPRKNDDSIDESEAVAVTFDGETIATLAVYDYSIKQWFALAAGDLRIMSEPLCWAYVKLEGYVQMPVWWLHNDVNRSLCVPESGQINPFGEESISC